MKQLICGSLNGMRIRVLAAAIDTSDGNAGPLEGAAAGSWSLGIVEQSKGEGCCLLRRDGSARGDVREEIVVGNACGGKLGSHGSEAILLLGHE